MLFAVLMCFVLVAATVIMHAVGLALLLRTVINPHAAFPAKTWPIARLLVHLTFWLLLIHWAEIAAWALFYLWAECLPDAETAFYFSGVTYATIGYGDCVLPRPWRMFGPVEGLVGILMCGLSTGLFFAVVSRIYNARTGKPRT